MLIQRVIHGFKDFACDAECLGQFLPHARLLAALSGEYKRKFGHDCCHSRVSLLVFCSHIDVLVVLLGAHG